MIISSKAHGSVSSNFEVDSKKFSIRTQDVDHIIDLLRSKLYSDPLIAFCREVVSNCRDANRESKSKDAIRVNVEVNPEDGSNPYIEFCDSGIGISPDRMENIYLNYGASTKRSTNTQTGGFGLGAKSPFAYTDTFYIVTSHGGKTYYYAMSLAGSGTGGMLLMDERESNGECGTIVKIPLKNEGDAVRATNIVSAVTYYWKESVEIYVDGKISVKTEVDGLTAVKGNLRATRTTSHVGAAIAGGVNSSIFVLIDGIPYQVPKITTDLFDSSTRLFIAFKNGEIGLVPSRDSIIANDETIELISRRLDKYHAAARDELIPKLSSIPRGTRLAWALVTHCLDYNEKCKANGNDMETLPHTSYPVVDISTYWVLRIANIDGLLFDVDKRDVDVLSSLSVITSYGDVYSHELVNILVKSDRVKKIVYLDRRHVYNRAVSLSRNTLIGCYVCKHNRLQNRNDFKRYPIPESSIQDVSHVIQKYIGVEGVLLSTLPTDASLETKAKGGGGSRKSRKDTYQVCLFSLSGYATHERSLCVSEVLALASEGKLAIMGSKESRIDIRSSTSSTFKQLRGVVSHYGLPLLKNDVSVSIVSSKDWAILQSYGLSGKYVVSDAAAVMAGFKNETCPYILSSFFSDQRTWLADIVEKDFPGTLPFLKTLKKIHKKISTVYGKDYEPYGFSGTLSLVAALAKSSFTMLRSAEAQDKKNADGRLYVRQMLKLGELGLLDFRANLEKEVGLELLGEIERKVSEYEAI